MAEPTNRDQTMKTEFKLTVSCVSACAQGTAFTCQGQFQNNGSLASGTYSKLCLEFKSHW